MPHRHAAVHGRWFLGFAALLALALSCRHPAHAQVVADPTQASIDLLRTAVNPQPNGSHLPLLFALRQLRDPQLRPLFLQLARRGEWQMQVHAVLGLAEIDPNHQVDPWLITQIGPEAQDAVIATALDMDMLAADRLPEIAQQDQLHSMAHMFVLAEQQLLKQPLDMDELTRLSKSDDDFVAGLASAILAQNGQAGMLKEIESRVAAKTGEDRAALAIWLIDASRRYELSAMSPWIATYVDADDLDIDLGYRATFALLMLDPKQGLAAWTKYLGKDPSFSKRVRCGTMLLACGKKGPAEAYDRLLPAAADEELIARVVDVGKAISAGSDCSGPMIALLDLGHPKTSMWAMEFLTRLPDEQTKPVYEHLIDRMSDPKPAWGDGIAQAVQSTSRLVEIDEAGVLRRLKAAEDDSALQQSLLLGMFESPSGSVAEAAAELPRMGSGRTDSLALILQAKHMTSLTDDQKVRLGMIAAGGGRVSTVLQVQAAWLYLRHTGQVDQALATVFAKE